MVIDSFGRFVPTKVSLEYNPDVALALILAVTPPKTTFKGLGGLAG